MDVKHRLESEKNKPENRHARLKRGVPFRYPLAIAIELSNECNSNCYMCPRENMTRSVGSMSWDTFTLVIDELAREKVVLRKLFFHWMGEPLLNNKFDKMISYAKNRNVAEMLVLASNCIALDEDKSRRLIASGLDELFVSLDAVTESSYQRIRKSKYSLDYVENNISRLVELKKEKGSNLPYIRLKILKSDINASEIETFKERWNEYVDEIYVEEDINTWNGTDSDVSAVVSGDSIYKERIEGQTHRFPCNRLWYQVAISHEGQVSPCIADWNGSGFIGSLHEATLYEIWNSPVLVEMRKKQLDHEYNHLSMCIKCTRWIHRNMGDWMIRNRKQALSVWSDDASKNYHAKSDKPL